ncbi:MAG: class I SAM-dependent methyltransferase [Dermatophilaceae bacterium]
MQRPNDTVERGRPCEICAAPTIPWHLLGGGAVERCPVCRHVRRPLASSPAHHRDLAYGGDPGLDRWRTALTYRALVAGGIPRSVFEIGYGAGALLRRFHDAGARIAGVDPGQLDVDVDPEVRAHGRLWSGPAEDLPDGWVAADLVVGVHVLEHVGDPLATLRKAVTMLEPGGRVVALTPAGDSWGPRTYGACWWMLEDPTHVRFFSAESLAQAAASVGLVDIQIDRLVLDSLTTDVGSMARMRGIRRPDGVLGSRGVLAAALATAPAVVGLRAMAPRTRPTLRLTAHRAAA